MTKLLLFCFLGLMCTSDSKIISSNDIKDDISDVYVEKILAKFMYLFDQSLELFNTLTSSNTTSDDLMKIIRKVDDVYRFLVEDNYLQDEIMSKGNRKSFKKRVRRQDASQDTAGYIGQYVTPVVEKLKNVYKTVQQKVGDAVSTLFRHVFSEKVDKA
ncbi:uncharacterized protein LOC143193020 [Rhynchophorus ferrugineus]|uniref:uncharacterized protein LOC143193020 n=1 Tax=Rhynchophorus ferrugineus TaxID=354439 RepID=UPI003FCE9D15